MRWFIFCLMMCWSVAVGAQDIKPIIDTVSLNLASMTQYHPPLVYDAWWIETQRCARRYVPRAQYRTVVWRYVLADAFVVVEGPHDARFVGMTSPWNSSIIVVLHHVLTERVIKHEMLHYILYHHGITGHSDVAFTRCRL